MAPPIEWSKTFCVTERSASWRSSARAANYLFVHERGARWLPVSTSIKLLLHAGYQLRYFLAAILSLRGKTGCALWQLLEVTLDKLSLLAVSHHDRFHDTCMPSSKNFCGKFLLLVITTLHVEATLVLTASHQSLLFPWWLPVITTLSTLKQHLCWLKFQSSLLFPLWFPVITTNAIGGIPCEEPIRMQWLAVTGHSCWLEVIGLLAHVRRKMSRLVGRQATCLSAKLVPETASYVAGSGPYIS